MKQIYLILLSVCFLAACSPFVDSRREAGMTHPLGQSTKEVVAICYNSFVTSPEELQQIADTKCMSTQQRAERLEDRYFNCRLLTPNTAFFKCPLKP